MRDLPTKEDLLKMQAEMVEDAKRDADNKEGLLNIFRELENKGDELVKPLFNLTVDKFWESLDSKEILDALLNGNCRTILCKMKYGYPCKNNGLVMYCTLEDKPFCRLVLNNQQVEECLRLGIDPASEFYEATRKIIGKIIDMYKEREYLVSISLRSADAFIQIESGIPAHKAIGGVDDLFLTLSISLLDEEDKTKTNYLDYVKSKIWRSTNKGERYEGRRFNLGGG